ncbi:CaiB/BaiF CoA transferase family protein [Amycolatopsis thermoflava]|uniref:CaiB/BaiF CoA transferase family protein n=1 Tax=Amycolatopsis thermoflava TaxID=84480 RepID=UPI00041E87DA|nr:CoA transferase [Amycolatopsis thermoflava]
MKPLADLRIIALEQYGAGPFGSLQLADLGADVIKIEDPGTGGDVGRQVPPFSDGENSLFFEANNRNKRSITLDLRVGEGREVFEDLVRHADAVFANLRGDVPAKLRIRYEDLAPINPRIVCCLLSGFGSSGPHAQEPAYDYVLQAYTGWMHLTGEPDGPPTKTGLSLVDFSGGLTAALSLLAAVHAARRDGVGMECDLSLYDTALAMLNYLGTWNLTAGYRPERTARSAHPSLVPFQLFAAQDGWLVMGCAKEKFWHRLVHAIERPDLADDPRFASFADRNAHRGELVAILDGILATRPVNEWLRVLKAAAVPCAPVNDVQQALDSEQTRARGMVVDFSHPAFGVVRSVNSAVRAGPVRTDHTRAPLRGEHTESVLRDVLGYEDHHLRRLHDAGALGKHGHRAN